MSELYDMIVVGGGPAALTAALFAQRRKMKVAIITLDIGGQTNLTEHIENYPGYTEHSGTKLMKIFERQVREEGAEIIFGRVVSIEKKDNSFKVLVANKTEYDSKVLVLAYGKVPRLLGVPGEDRFFGRGVSTSPTFDAHLFKGKTVAIVGGGNSAVEGALMCADIAKKVYLIHRRDEFRAEPVTIDKLKANSRVELLLNYHPAEIAGNKKLESIVVENVNTLEKRTIPVDCVFVQIGYEVRTDFLKDIVKLNALKEIEINAFCETSAQGIFAAGDVTNVPYKQTIVSAGEGAKAAISAYNYLLKLEGKPPVKMDWG